MKNKSFNKIVIATLLSFSISSCQKDLLDPVPQTSVSDLSAYDTPDRIESLVNGLYRSIKNGSNQIGGNFLGGRYLIHNDIRGEDFLNQTGNGVTGLQTWNFTINASSNEVQNLWAQAYYAINGMNLFLDKIDTAPAKVAADKVANYKAEARFLRALSYFSLVTLYAQPYTKNGGTSLGLPLRLKGENGSGNSNNLKRSTVAEVYAQILEDLNFAEANLPANYATQDLNVTRAHKNTAIALKTRVYLAMGKYNEVVTEASKLVPANAPFKATTGVKHELNANFAAIFTTYKTLESIFSMPMATNDVPGTQNQLAFYYLAGPVGGGEFSLNPSGIYGSKSLEDTDDRKKLTSVSGTRIYLTKFPGASPFIDWVPIMRYSEVLLNLAEAKARLSASGVDATALALVNAVRARSKGTAIVPATKDDLISAILTERRIEFLGEGLRSLDITRLNANFPAKGPVNAVNPTQAEYIWPIPTNELTVNKDCLPN